MVAIAIGGDGAAPERWTARAAAIVALCFAINMADGIDITMLSFIAPRVERDLAIGPQAMGMLFSAGLVGMMLGAMAIAPLADRFGRRRIVIAGLLLMSAGMLAGGVVRTLGQFVALRVLTGGGIGTVLAAMAALVAEAAPARQRNLAVGLVQAGYPFAGVFTGLAVAALLPGHGWHALLAGAGAISVLLLPPVWALLSDAVPGADPDEDARPANALGRVLDAGLRRRTLLLWAAIFCGLMVLYFIVSWITRLAIAAGLAETDGIYAGSLYGCGAFVGTIGMSVLALRVPLRRLVPAMLIAAAGAMLWFGSVAMSEPATLAVAFLIGVLLQGGYNGLWPIAAGAYPGAVRATGIGWAMGVGRAGAIIGPWLGGVLLQASVSLPALFALFCVPLLIAAGCVWRIGAPAEAAA